MEPLCQLPAVVPAPASIEAGRGAPFRLDAEHAHHRGCGCRRRPRRARPGPHRRLDLRRLGTTARTQRPAIDLRDRAGGAAESYRIAADAASVVVTGADAAGLFYGVQTLGQLIARDGDGVGSCRPSQIEDAPRFAYRGVMLDVARHFHPVETVKAYIDRAAGLKFNALHLHLTDDQGWRIHLDSRPKLTELASGTAVGGDPGGFYTKADYREIVEYAASRHMIVVPEIDMPGHTHAVGLAYPELAEAPVLSTTCSRSCRDHGGERARGRACRTTAWPSASRR